MAFKKNRQMELIADNLAFLSKSTSLENTIGLFNSNRLAQEFFKDLFNLIFGYELVELDLKHKITNFPGIDLGDEKLGLGIQITTDSSSTKIKDTIETFQSDDKCKNYSRVQIYIIGNKKSYTTEFTTNGKFEFIPDRDIWDDDNLMQEINKISDLKKIDAIAQFLDERLLEFKFPEILTPSDIKTCINILKRDFGTVQSIQFKIETRELEDYINKKNAINNITWEFFKEKIQAHLKYNSDFNQFISDPINSEIQDDYFCITKAIQDYYHSLGKVSFENVFRDVFLKLNLYDDEIPGIAVKMKIILHNMYFNCDIGDNPDETT